MNKYLERLRNDFQGGADALIAKSQEVAKTLSLEQEASEGNERLLRHYVSIGVVDKPTREGRDAFYGFRHLVQFVAARRLLAEGFPLAKIAKYTAVVPTDALTAYLDKPDRASEAELLVAAFRTEAPVRSAPAQSSRRPAAPKPLPSVATGMGMVDVMHEMREMEQRVHGQLKDLQSRVHAMVDEALRGVGSKVQVQRIDPVELKVAVSKLADLMEEATHRFDRMLQKPMLMIEKQMDQQRYLFEEAYKQKDFLERMFGGLFDKQRHELLQFLDDQSKRQHESLEMQRHFNKDISERFDHFEMEMASKLALIEKHVHGLLALTNPTPKTNPTKKEGAL
jgi:DNA-binding transcriptional MerR regulator